MDSTVVNAAAKWLTELVYQAPETCTNLTHHADLDLNDPPDSGPALNLSDLLDSGPDMSLNVEGELGTAISAYIAHERDARRGKTTLGMEYRTPVWKGRAVLRTEKHGRGRLY